MRIWFYVLTAATIMAGTGMLFSARAHTAKAAEAAPAVRADNAWSFSFTSIDGKPMPLDQYKGRVLLVVNTASMCGLTPQYEGLEQLQKTYGPRGLTVIGVPSADFNQEYEDNSKIKEFCETKFGINFPLTQSSSVTGPKALPFYRWAKASLSADNEPKWNFHKFLVGRDGKLVRGFASRVIPEDKNVIAAIEKALG